MSAGRTRRSACPIGCWWSKTVPTNEHCWRGGSNYAASKTRLARTETKTLRLPHRLLVVEDDPNERELLAGLLELYGFEVATCAHGDEALAALARGPRPDLVLLDMKMPRCNGMEVVERIRATQELADLTLFAVSGTSPAARGICTDALGVDATLRLPLYDEL